MASKMLPMAIGSALDSPAATPPNKEHNPFERAASLVLGALPILWCVAVFGVTDWRAVRDVWYMGCIGVFAAIEANSVPVGGGIVFVPALMALGIDIQLGAAFTVATMTFGNGVFGFTSWLIKDPTVFEWRAFPFTVPAAWAGAVVGTLCD